MQQWNSQLEEARRFFGIQGYPGNLFEFFSDSEKVIEKYKILLFKQDIDKLSGFIGYNNNYTIICVNFKRNIGHQNFTLAHEIGHMFLHNGISKSDLNPEKASNDRDEIEANAFATELIYPQEYVDHDLIYIQDHDLMNSENWDDLAYYINSLCEKYYTSFKFTFNRLVKKVFNSYEEKEAYYKQFKKHIGKFSEKFPAYMHVVDYNHEFYQSFYEPYNYMKRIIDKLVTNQEMGSETGEAMVERYDRLEG